MALLSNGYGRLVTLCKAMVLMICFSLSASAQEITIAALGDSLTAGYGLDQADGFVPQLQSWLEARGHAVTVLNAGVSGDTSAGGLARVDWTLGADVDALIVALGGNDVLRALPPETTRANLDGILQAADMPVLLVGLEAPLNYGPDYKAEFEAIFPELAAAHDALLYPDFLAAPRAALADGVATDVLLQPDMLHPTAVGVGYMVEAIGPMVEALIAQVN